MNKVETASPLTESPTGERAKVQTGGQAELQTGTQAGRQAGVRAEGQTGAQAETGAPPGESRCGRIAIVGRPNVGKSTLLNHLLGRKISITSRKPQTTRHQVLGVKTAGDAQLVFVDTPGLLRRAPKALNRYMNRAAANAIGAVDAAVMVVDRTAWQDGDELVLERLSEAPPATSPAGTSPPTEMPAPDASPAGTAGKRALPIPVILAINKIDLLKDKTALLPFIQFLSERADFREIVPVSALRGRGLAELEASLRAQLPAAEHLFPPETVTDRNERFMAAELLREKITRRVGDEVLYAAAVAIEEFKRRGRGVHISALIYVEREGQKRILVGKDGARLRAIGEDARKDMEKLFAAKVMLRLWVKRRKGWADDERALRSLGYDG